MQGRQRRAEGRLAAGLQIDAEGPIAGREGQEAVGQGGRQRIDEHAGLLVLAVEDAIGHALQRPVGIRGGIERHPARALQLGPAEHRGQGAVDVVAFVKGGVGRRLQVHELLELEHRTLQALALGDVAARAAQDGGGPVGRDGALEEQLDVDDLAAAADQLQVHARRAAGARAAEMPAQRLQRVGDDHLAQAHLGDLGGVEAEQLRGRTVHGDQLGGAGGVFIELRGEDEIAAVLEGALVALAAGLGQGLPAPGQQMAEGQQAGAEGDHDQGAQVVADETGDPGPHRGRDLRVRHVGHHFQAAGSALARQLHERVRQVQVAVGGESGAVLLLAFGAAVNAAPEFRGGLAGIESTGGQLARGDRQQAAAAAIEDAQIGGLTAALGGRTAEQMFGAQAEHEAAHEAPVLAHARGQQQARLAALGLPVANLPQGQFVQIHRAAAALVGGAIREDGHRLAVAELQVHQLPAPAAVEGEFRVAVLRLREAFQVASQLQRLLAIELAGPVAHALLASALEALVAPQREQIGGRLLQPALAELGLQAQTGFLLAGQALDAPLALCREEQDADGQHQETAAEKNAQEAGHRLPPAAFVLALAHSAGLLRLVVRGQPHPEFTIAAGRAQALQDLPPAVDRCGRLGHRGGCRLPGLSCIPLLLLRLRCQHRRWMAGGQTCRSGISRGWASFSPPRGGAGLRAGRPAPDRG